MTDLEKIVDLGLLKEGEEIYLPYKNTEHRGRVIEGGKKIRTPLGDFSSLSGAAGSFYASLPKEICQIKVLIGGTHFPSNGWSEWKTWNGKRLSELRKKIK